MRYTGDSLWIQLADVNTIPPVRSMYPSEIHCDFSFITLCVRVAALHYPHPLMIRISMVFVLLVVMGICLILHDPIGVIRFVLISLVSLSLQCCLFFILLRPDSSLAMPMTM